MMHSRSFLTPFLSILLVLLCPALCQAQFAQRGGVEGTVTDASDAVVPQAALTLLDLTQNTTKRSTTDERGHYSFAEVPAGTYRITVERAGFATASSEVITVDLGQTLRYDVRMTLGPASEKVTVESSTVALETGQTSLNTNVSQQQFEELPLNGRNFTSVAALAPGVSTQPQLNVNPGGTYSVGAQFASGGVAFTSGGVVQGSRDNGFY
ncbi:MAG TPA: carboxypeptidase-like regulatory domain-containing protein, partial [Acidobacteriaceae bacterium]